MKPQTKHRLLTLWLPVVLAFVLVIGAWSILITIAAKHPVEQVPLKSDAVDE